MMMMVVVGRKKERRGEGGKVQGQVHKWPVEGRKEWKNFPFRDSRFRLYQSTKG